MNNTDYVHQTAHALRGKEVLNIEIAALEAARDALNSGFSESIAQMSQTLSGGGKLVMTGLGKNLPIAEKIAATLTSTGAPAITMNPIQALHGDLGLIQDGDTIIVLSFSGETEELVHLIPMLKRRHVTVIAITAKAESTLGRCADIVIPLPVKREACPFNMAPTASTTATLAVGDALAMALLDARGFKQEDYAKLHPGGAIGRTLLLKVSDIMRNDERLAIVKQSAVVKDAVLAMTRARAGSAAVVNDDGSLAGIFTDGDLRRHIAEDDAIMDRNISDVMTADPIRLRDNDLAVDVLSIFEQNNIDDVPVVDANGKLVGAVDIQDLPKLKIM